MKRINYNKRIIAIFTLTLFACLLCFSPLFSAVNKFKDPLDYPAREQINPSKWPLVGVCYTGSRLVSVGPRGLIIVSENDGDTWKQSNVPVQSDLVAVNFPTKNLGWAVGHDGVILHSDDGGNTWIKQFDGRMAEKQFRKYYEENIQKADDSFSKALELTKLNYEKGPALPFLDVYFENQLTGYAVGTFGLISKTTDGGKSWSPLMHKIDNFQPTMSLNNIKKIHDNLYITSERGCVFILNKKRDYFEKRETGYKGTFFGITGNDRVILAYGIRGAMYRSRDEGNSWEALSIPTHATISAGIAIASGDGFLFVTQAGELLSCDGSANNFSVKMADTPMFVVAAAMTPSEHLIMASIFQGVARQLFTVSPKRLPNAN